MAAANSLPLIPGAGTAELATCRLCRFGAIAAAHSRSLIGPQWLIDRSPHHTHAVREFRRSEFVAALVPWKAGIERKGGLVETGAVNVHQAEGGPELVANKIRRRGAPIPRRLKKLQAIRVEPGLELFFGLVAPTGCDVDLVCQELIRQLDAMQYESELIHISQLIDAYTGSGAKNLKLDRRISRLMDKGTKLRQGTEAPDVCARLAIVAVRQIRKERLAHFAEGKPVPRMAYVFRSLKTPAEVDALRNTYGAAFNLISVYSSEEERVDHLSKEIAASYHDTDSAKYRDKAQGLIYRDREEKATSGQNVRDTFPRADLFLALRPGSPESIEQALRRFIHLIFGNPYVTPTKDEYGMFAAKAVAARSADLGRQVGAVITNESGELVAAGCNEVPKFGGGQYWEGDVPDVRDFRIGSDPAVQNRMEALSELFERFSRAKWLSGDAAKKRPSELALEMVDGPKRKFFSGSQILGILEYGRSVHAEMAAITEAARRGVAVAGCTLFTTTFPCHLCARHIISSGIKRVVYVEPYPKSRTQVLYPDSIEVNPRRSVSSKVSLEPFMGVSPNRYLAYFEPSVERKDNIGRVIDWEAKREKNPRLKRFVASYFLLEQRMIKDL
jgi:deoxycytidylate deaminase